ncbi:hypothetical protein ACHAWF_003662 [Thalassiosira exigua]
MRSCCRWKKRKEPFGLTGHHRFLLALFKKFYHKAAHEGSVVFIACYSDDHAVFTSTEIYNALQGMDTTRKEASATACQAFMPENIQQHRKFWSHPAPTGIRRVRHRDMIDIDKCAVELHNANQNYGHAARGRCVQKIENYGRSQIKFTVILAIEAGDPTMFDCGHQIICHIPYRPHEAPIEFAIEQFSRELRSR